MSGLTRADLREWNDFWRRWEKLTKELPKAKQQALRMAGMAVERELLRQIDQRIADPRGRVKKWQDLREGSGGGYVAVTASSDEVVQLTKSGKKTTSRAVTRYLEQGHPARKPSGGRDKRYKARLVSDNLVGGNHGLIVPGRMFYSWTKLRAGDLGRDAAEKTLQKIKAAIEHGGDSLT
ncbi:hypothetical protein [Oscillibacter ruminantium]|uniref:hypothetical protein n=1 Tax=Oscillibacter ruminantium TaxID=1263547 RepID=UPI0002D38EA3|nr:hypothetical protein [Oscillibacter ruminantium]